MKSSTVYKVLAAVVTLGLFAIAVVFAVGNLSWAPATDVAATESALTTDTFSISAEVPQQAAGNIPTEALMAELYENVSPSVVNIRVTQAALNGTAPFPGMPQQGEGTGWIWSEDGYIVTNNHVVENAEQIVVIFENGHWADAELIAADPQADLAVIQVDAPPETELTPLPLSDTSPTAGDYALAFGSPFGLAGSMTKGIISAVGRSFQIGEPTATGAQYSLPEVIQTDAAINPGNSGGPLINLNGEVIGVNFAIRSGVQANAGVGFAIPVSIVREVIPALIEEGAYTYPYLGIAGGTVNRSVVEEQNLPDNQLGVFVSRVPAGGPADQAGVEEGDVITGIDDQTVRSFEDLITYLITATSPGDTVTLQILRDGEMLSLDVTIGERPTGAEATQPVEQVTVGTAIDIARDAVAQTGLLDTVESADARLEERNGASVWVVTLTGADQEATVIVDAVTGEVLDISAEDEG